MLRQLPQRHRDSLIIENRHLHPQLRIEIAELDPRVCVRGMHYEPVDRRSRRETRYVVEACENGHEEFLVGKAASESEWADEQTEVTGVGGSRGGVCFKEVSRLISFSISQP